MPAVPESSPPDPKPPANLAERLATSTTRLILIAITAGGLLTVAANLRRIAPPGRGDHPAEGAHPHVDVLPADPPVSREIVNGDEAAARDASLRIWRTKLIEANASPERVQPGVNSSPQPEVVVQDLVELARDPGGKWSIRQVHERRRTIVGVATGGPEPTVVLWGGYDETGPGEWTIWTMRLPQFEK